MKRVLLGFAAIAMMAAPAAGQTVRLDEGTFRILVDGREVGTETFSLRQNGTGPDAVVIAQGKVILDSNETTANVQLAGAGLRVVAYDVELSGTDARRIRASVTGSRASARTMSSAGETMKEYLVSEGAVLLDDGVAHHYYMIGQRAAAGASRVAILVPRESRQVQATLSGPVSDQISIGGLFFLSGDVAPAATRKAFRVALAVESVAVVAAASIRPDETNPSYWQFQGKPVVLLGGSDVGAAPAGFGGR